MRRTILIFFLAICWAGGRAWAQDIGVKTNILYWATSTPNLGFEFGLGKRTTLDLAGGYNPWTLDREANRKIRHWMVMPEFRYWFNGRPMVREYVGISALATSYNIKWGEKRYNGDAGGVGLTVGYSLHIMKRMNLEFYGGFGVVLFRHKQYNIYDNLDDYTADGLGKVNAHGYKLLPTKLGVSISYIIK